MEKRKWSVEEVKEYRKKHKQYIFYFNKDDANFCVPKMYGIGWASNWAHPLSAGIVLALIVLAVLNIYFKLI